MTLVAHPLLQPRALFPTFDPAPYSEEAAWPHLRYVIGWFSLPLGCSRCGAVGFRKRGMPHKTQLYHDVPSTCWPIVYSPEYNITFMGLEKLHPFDAGKWGKVINFLKEEKLIADDTIVVAQEATDEDLLVVHTRRYLNKLKWSFVVATITEIPPVLFLPNFLVQRKVLKPLRTQTGGTIMAGKLAMDRGWAINVGGGFHHCSSDKGGGFCAYADITLTIKVMQRQLRTTSSSRKKNVTK